ncbi:hypothetical protein ACK8GE_14280 [Micromonosporaceae bacterium DT194]|uniref:hypothetical protein n=1 Tax=Melissospora conviva TaxID=3388432 RepID=UPI003C1E5D54
MSASIELPAHPHASADLEDDLYQDVPDVSTNNGQIAGIVHGGMHQHKTIIENKLMSDLITRHHLTPAYIGHVMRAFAPREYRLGDITLDRARASRLVTTESWTVLCGAPNSGLRTAAVALLHEPSHGGLRLEEILIDEERERRFTGGDLPAERGVIYLLRLPDQPDRVSPDGPAPL